MCMGCVACKGHVLCLCILYIGDRVCSMLCVCVHVVDIYALFFRPEAIELSTLVQEDGPSVAEGCLGNMPGEDRQGSRSR